MLDYIRYYNDLIIISWHSVIVIKTSLIDTDNVEIIDLDKITKIDTIMQWVTSNILSYWKLVLEQYRDRTRTFNHIYKPYKVANSIKEAKMFYEKNKKRVL